MKLLDFGSLNIDHCYRLSHLARAGETLASSAYRRNGGGKGFNQALALAKAGQRVHMAGAIGQDGLFLRDMLEATGVDVSRLQVIDEATGHAVIQVDDKGCNSIILYGGANQMNTPERIEAALNGFGRGDYVLLQNEINLGREVLLAAKGRGMHVILNPSPVSQELLAWPLDMLDWLILNEIEGFDLTGEKEPERMLDTLVRKYPACRVVLTLGDKGAVYADRERRVFQQALSTEVVDSTAAGDTFTGYFFCAVLEGRSVEEALLLATVASSITVSRAGAGGTIPLRAEVEERLHTVA